MHQRSLCTGHRPCHLYTSHSRGQYRLFRKPTRFCCRRSSVSHVIRATQEDYYAVLGVPRNADLKQIKQAFKKKALKLHPDVNKAPDAKDKFMECKRAYQALSDTKQRSRYDREQSGGGSAGGFNWDDVVSGGAKSRQAAEEAFYGFGDFFRDIDKDRKERQKRKGKEQPMSLWEEIADIGEEFVEFLEKETGLSSAEADRQRSQARASTQESTERARTEAQRQSQGAEERAQRAKATAEAGAKKINDDVEEMLQQMKRDLGIK
ncbi:g1101 [Coccomyxa viridis]|uniref:G1101 protein n=1 Tax=Coccomyxa viridis TaxID=1274662 RepID=A0ABP1FH79_9CHLO